MKLPLGSTALLLVSLAGPMLAHADVPGEHPAYLHAISDLRAARWLVMHRPGDWKQTEDEVRAVHQIDEALRELKHAAIDDGKNLEDHPPVDERVDQPGRIHESIDYLRKARADVSREEDNGFANGLRAHSIAHVDEAIQALKRVVHE